MQTCPANLKMGLRSCGGLRWHPNKAGAAGWAKFLKTRQALLAANLPLLVACRLGAQTNSAPATFLEAFDQQTNVVLVRGYSSQGSVNLDGATISVSAVMVNDVTDSRSAMGLALEIQRTDPQTGAHSRFSYKVDRDEINSLVGGLDYVSRANWGVTPLNGFEAHYQTRSGFKVAARSDRRDATVDLYFDIGPGCHMKTNSDQISQFRGLITQASAVLDGLK